MMEALIFLAAIVVLDGVLVAWVWRQRGDAEPVDLDDIPEV